MFTYKENLNKIQLLTLVLKRNVIIILSMISFDVLFYYYTYLRNDDYLAYTIYLVSTTLFLVGFLIKHYFQKKNALIEVVIDTVNKTISIDRNLIDASDVIKLRCNSFGDLVVTTKNKQFLISKYISQYNELLIKVSEFLNIKIITDKTNIISMVAIISLAVFLFSKIYYIVLIIGILLLVYNIFLFREILKQKYKMRWYSLLMQIIIILAISLKLFNYISYVILN